MTALYASGGCKVRPILPSGRNYGSALRIDEPCGNQRRGINSSFESPAHDWCRDLVPYFA